MRTSIIAVAAVLALATPAWANEFVDYFDYGRTDLSAHGYEMTRSVAQYTHLSPEPWIGIYGHMDTAEAAEFSDELGARRAQAVATELVRLGVEPSRIRMFSCGATQLSRPTGQGVREPLNRLVVVGINFGSRPARFEGPASEGQCRRT